VHREKSSEISNLSALHERLVFRQEGPGKTEDRMADWTPTVGLNNSFMVNTYYPLYSEFFRCLGFRVELPQKALQEGIERKRAPFCYPAEAAHGYFAALLERKPDFLFLPHVKGVFVGQDKGPSTVCPLSQGEPYYLSTAFKDHPHLIKLEENRRVLRPVLDFSRGVESASEAMTDLATALGRSRKEARNAFTQAMRLQEQTRRAIQDMGRELLKELVGHDDRFAIVIFGRTYNACASRLNMGIPDKFASRGIRFSLSIVCPWRDHSAPGDMYWSTGQMF
jgi:predicted nucleotide-binding protein (sugar kinase/HSP70/actin superfamily)